MRPNRVLFHSIPSKSNIFFYFHPISFRAIRFWPICPSLRPKTVEPNKALNEAGQICTCVKSARRILSDTFWDADEKDFAYVLHITCMCIQSDEQNFLLNACYLWEYPAGSDVYDSLEKKYRKLILWPLYERRLIFDTNDALMSVVSSLMHCGWQGMPTTWRMCGGRASLQRLEAGKVYGCSRVVGMDCEHVMYQIAESNSRAAAVLLLSYNK